MDTIKLGVTYDVFCFNDGATAKAIIIERLAINPGRFILKGLAKYDAQRMGKAEKQAQKKEKEKEVKKAYKEKERRSRGICEEEYCAGGF